MGITMRNRFLGEEKMCDLIERQAAIDAIEELDWYHQNCNNEMVSGANSSEHQAWYKADDVYKALEDLPSAQPKIIQCKDCKHCATETDKDGTCYSCTLIYDAYTFWQDVEPTDFCSWAERREDG